MVYYWVHLLIYSQRKSGKFMLYTQEDERGKKNGKRK